MIHPFERTRGGSCTIVIQCSTKSQSTVSLCYHWDFKSMMLTHFPRFHNNLATVRMTARRQYWTRGGQRNVNGNFRSRTLLRAWSVAYLSQGRKRGNPQGSRNVQRHSYERQSVDAVRNHCIHLGGLLRLLKCLGASNLVAIHLRSRPTEGRCGT